MEHGQSFESHIRLGKFLEVYFLKRANLLIDMAWHAGHNPPSQSHLLCESVDPALGDLPQKYGKLGWHLASRFRLVSELKEPGQNHQSVAMYNKRQSKTLLLPCIAGQQDMCVYHAVTPQSETASKFEFKV